MNSNILQPNQRVLQVLFYHFTIHYQLRHSFSNQQIIQLRSNKLVLNSILVAFLKDYVFNFEIWINLAY